MGQEYDLEGDTPDRGAQAEALSKGGAAEQEGHAGSGSPTGAPSRVARLGYSDPPSCYILTEDILFEKSPRLLHTWQGCTLRPAWRPCMTMTIGSACTTI